MMKKMGLLLLLLPMAFRPPDRAASFRGMILHGPGTRPGSAETSAIPAAATGFAVVELFTSEGCSSCPPADAALARAARDYKEHVYVMGFHVDYWDRLGWKDPYSNAAHTQRQQEYAALFRLNSIYTPEVVVNGKKEFVGGDETKWRATIEEELKNSAAVAGIALGISAGAADGKKLGVSCTVTDTKAPLPKGVSLKFVLVQLQALSQVKRGENEGRKLEHINVVRDLRSIAVDGKGQAHADLKIPEGLTGKDCKVIVFLQDKDRGTILAAAETAIR